MRGILDIRMLSMRAARLVVLGASLVLTNAAQAQNSEHKTLASSATQPTQKVNNSATEPSTAANEEKSIGAKGDVHVHGHWVIDVRDPDGTLVTHREFENSYQGGNMLASIMGRLSSVGLWGVNVEGTQVYSLFEPLETRVLPSLVSRNLSLSFSATSFVLSGSFTAPSTDSIGYVSTVQAPCAANIAPATPCSVDYLQFTVTTFAPISFVQGQIVQVTVTITFS
jgi:hypothetical protein